MVASSVTDVSIRDYLGCIADDYDAYRPTYPAEVAKLLVDADPPAGGMPTRIYCDVGAGTGIFSRVLAHAAPVNHEIVAIEPNDHMRRRAMASSMNSKKIRYLSGSAEKIPLPDQCCALVTAATAASWFKRDEFFAEARRILHPGGTLAIVQNRRLYRKSALLEGLEAILEKQVTGYQRGMHYRPDGGFAAVDYADELVGAKGYCAVLVRHFYWTQYLSPEDFVQLAMSLTVAQDAARRIGEPALRQQFDMLAQACGHGHALPVPYVTEVTIARTRVM